MNRHAIEIERQAARIERICNGDASPDDATKLIANEFESYAVRAKLVKTKESAHTANILPYLNAWAFATCVPLSMLADVRTAIIPKKKPGPKAKV